MALAPRGIPTHAGTVRRTDSQVRDGRHGGDAATSLAKPGMRINDSAVGEKLSTVTSELAEKAPTDAVTVAVPSWPANTRPASTPKLATVRSLEA